MKNEIQKAVRHCLFGVSLTVIIALAMSALAQTGDNMVFGSSGIGVPSDAFIDASQFSGDLCGKILAAWNSLSTRSGTIDARALTGPQTCGASPFPANKNGVLLLGNAQISTDVTWNVPTRVRVEGLGSQGAQGSATGTLNTIIYASPSFPTTGASVVQLGDASGNKAYQAQVRDMTIDCKGVPGCVGLFNESAEEASTVDNVIVFNAPAIGVHVTTAYTVVTGGAANSGPYRNISIQYTGCTCSGAVGLQIDGGSTGQVLRGFDNITVSGSPGNSGIGILIDGTSTQLTNSHVEYFATGIQIGQSGVTTSNVQIQNVNISNNQSSWDIIIDGPNTGDVILLGINNNSPNNQLLQDNVTGNIVTGTNLGLYLLGDITSGAASNTAVISTSPKVSSGANLKWVAPGDLGIVGHLSKGSGSFKIDDPLDPGQKYLYHSFVESPEMMNVYNGVVTTDWHGMATVTLPAYFEALNRDFRYQLTPIGSFAQATVMREVRDNQFTIRTTKPGIKVSWQVTGVRHDPYADAHRVPVEEEKPPRDRGHYLHSEAADPGARNTPASRVESQQ